ncbi:MAG: hypothetical protein ACE5H7_17185 [Acidiferrobacterales bacterium]
MGNANTDRLGLRPYLVGLGVLGITTLFLPFTHDVAPLQAIVLITWDWYLGHFDDTALLILLVASPFVLTIPIIAASVQGLLPGRRSRPAWLTAYALALAMAGVTLSVLALSEFYDNLWEEYFIVFSPLTVLALGIGWIIRNWRRGLAHTLNAVIAMQVVYIANGALCLALFFDEGWESGAYMTLVTVVLYLAAIALVSSTRSTAVARP